MSLRSIPKSLSWLALMLPMMLSSVSALTFGHFTYEVINGNEVRITDYPETESGSLAIPDVIDTKSVTSIGSNAFQDCSLLTSISIPSSVNHIGPAVFVGCDSLTSLTVDAANTEYSSLDGVLYNKAQTILLRYPEGKVGGFTVPNSVTRLWYSCFFDCSNLTSIIIPVGVTTIDSQVFWGCSSLTSVVIPDGVFRLSSYLFKDCSGLTSVTIPNSVTSIDAQAFNGCSDLSSVSIPSGVNSIGAAAFAYCSSLTSITIPHGVTSIPNQAFTFCTNLLSVTIPGSVTSISNFAFRDCTSLSSVTIPVGVKTIGDNAFLRCLDLGSLTLSNTVESIGVAAFSSCNSLASVTIPSSVSSIGSNAFGYSSSLTAISVDTGNMNYSSEDGVLFDKAKTTLIQYPNAKAGGYTIPDGVTNLISASFGSCVNLTNVNIASSVTSIGEYAFSGCSNLISTYFRGDAPAALGVNAFSNTAVGHVIYYSNTSSGFMTPNWQGYASVRIPFSYTIIGGATIQVADCLASEAGSIVIPNSIEGLPVTSIGDYAFSSCSSITGVTIPDSVISIGNRVFEYCSSLATITVAAGNADYSSVGGVLFSKDQSTLIQYPAGKTGRYTIPGGVTSLGDRAFASCSGLMSISISSGVTMIGHNVFQGCNSLSATYFEGNAPTSIGSHVFLGVAARHRVYYSTTATGFTSPLWNGYAAEKFQYSYVVVGGTTITITDYPTSETGDIVIPALIEGKPVTGIGNNAFLNCSSLTRVGIPSSVTSIGSWAFSNCSSLATVRIPKSVTTIQDGSFFGCSSLTDIIIPSSITSLGSFAFEGCSNLTATYFAGNAPLDGINMFESVAAGHKVYYLDSSTGFSSPWWSGNAAEAIDTAAYPAAKWLLELYLAYDTPLEQDLNGDGVSLLMAYALDLDPNVRLTTELPTVEMGSTTLELKYYAGTAGVTYRVETSKDMITWVTTGVTVSAADSEGVVTASIPRGAVCGFLRLVVVEG